MGWTEAPQSLRPGYLDPRTLKHTVSNIADCLTDPGPIPRGVAVRARRMHESCSSQCRVKGRVAEVLAAPADSVEGDFE